MKVTVLYEIKSAEIRIYSLLIYIKAKAGMTGSQRWASVCERKKEGRKEEKKERREAGREGKKKKASSVVHTSA